jgi:flagellar basal-body rod protein FlgB
LSLIDDAVGAALHRSLNALSLRQQVTMQNIANVDTPGYKAKEVPFEAELSRALEAKPVRLATTHATHFAMVGDTPGVRVVDNKTTWRNDGNSVDIERELATLSETTIMYSAVTQQVGARIGLLRRVITDGRG